MKAKLIEDFTHMPPKSIEEIRKAYNKIVNNIAELEDTLDNQDVDITQDDEKIMLVVDHSWTRSEDDFDSDFDLNVRLEVDFLNNEIRGDGTVTNDDLQDWLYDYEETYPLDASNIEDLATSIDEAIEQVAGSIEYTGAAVDEARELMEDMEGDEDDDDEFCDECDEELDEDGRCPNCDYEDENE